MSDKPVVLKVAYFYPEGYSGESHVYTKVLAKVKNLSYWKDVRLHYSTGAGWNDESLRWSANYGDYDIFSGISGVIDVSSLQFVIAYMSGGVTYWDNNSWKNYRLNSQWQPEIGNNVLLNKAEYVMGGTPGACYVTGINGEILVRNLSYNKHVGIRYSVDGNAWHDIPASFRQSIGSVEVWSFELNLSPTGFGPVEFAVYYNNMNTGEWWWDNNFGQNYDMRNCNEIEGANSFL
jgi:hypothetical protein